MTGSLSVRGDVLPVGGVTHKIEAAAKAGCTRVIIPQANEQDVMIEDEYKDMIEVIPVSHISGVLDIALEGETEKDSLVSRLKSITGSALKEGASPDPPVRARSRAASSHPFLIRRSQRRTMSGKPTVGEYMTRDVETVSPDETVKAVAQRMAESNGHNGFPVTQGRTVEGFVSAADLLLADDEAPVFTVMSDDLIVAHPDMKVTDAARVILRSGISGSRSSTTPTTSWGSSRTRTWSARRSSVRRRARWGS